MTFHISTNKKAMTSFHGYAVDSYLSCNIVKMTLVVKDFTATGKIRILVIRSVDDVIDCTYWQEH